MSDMKCPFCQQELVREGSDNYWCKKCNLERCTPALYGSQKLWQELIRTRKALGVAVDALKELRPTEKKSCYLVPTVSTTQRIIDEALAEITALEQKD